MRGSCHCGKVQVQLSSRPTYVNFCDCTLCAKSGGAWAYFTLDEVETKGKTTVYSRRDYDDPAVEIQFCPNCGTVTHWHLTTNFSADRIGVNIRLFAPAELAGIEARFPDGRHWEGDGPPGTRRPPGTLGKDAFI